MATLVAVLVLCAAGIGAAAAQIRCVDAAREAARLAGRGDASAVPAALRVAPGGAGIRIRQEGDFVIATVTVGAAGLPGLTLTAEAVAAVEPPG
ncbi:TadE family type IV pilus minor pilin [Mycolicibacterium mengxianglii]|uniref:TadE family type IV pilus minor pilin n=1 Tax=Mycolicibacterium mengxianglii TaxID=2736649 RepID=UPI0027DA4D2F|nr:TadE family type IV pilus minor pilin [Mycolicibacterium mengxianglii]